MSSLTFVTAFFQVYENSEFRSNEWRFQQFRILAETGIQICLYTSSDLVPVFEEMSYPNVRVLTRFKDHKETWISKICKECAGMYTLPNNRNMEKDTESYIQIQNSKTEFIQETISQNPWNSTHFAWIDFSIAHIFKNVSQNQSFLKSLSKCTTLNPSFFIIPGCCNKWNPEQSTHFQDNIHWRFCGGFFMADKESMQIFCDECKTQFPVFLQMTHKILWEVNFWSWLESISLVWNPTWFFADHNDEMLQKIPTHFLCQPLVPLVPLVTFTYPAVQYYLPSSASYLFYKGRHWLNTRYVNYYFTNQGYYLFPDQSKIIKNQNWLCELDSNFTPTTFRKMSETNIGIPQLSPNACSIGLEDIRLYEFQGRIRFIATSMNYSPTGRNRMVVGDYDLEKGEFLNGCVVVPPNRDSWCEKNWIPIDRGDGKEWFIYQWSPMIIGYLEQVGDEICLNIWTIKSPSSRQLISDKCNGYPAIEIAEGVKGEVLESTPNKLDLFQNISQVPWFNRVRGSTIFTRTVDGWVGLVHFSEEMTPRHYFHMMVLLDLDTLKPMKHSQPFVFVKTGVEFCIGMAIDSEPDNYIFWISRMDRDPVMIRSKVIMDQDLMSP